MYRVARTGPHGRLYSSKGLLQFHNEGQESLILEFKDLERAKKYCSAFVRRYPQAICTILSATDDSKIIDSFRDESYWVLKDRNSAEWDKVSSKGRLLEKLIALAGVLFVSAPVVLVLHYLGTIEAPLSLKLLVGPTMAVATAYLYYWMFARIC